MARVEKALRAREVAEQTSEGPAVEQRVAALDVIIVRFAAALEHTDVLFHRDFGVISCKIARVMRITIARAIDLNGAISEVSCEVIGGPNSKGFPTAHKSPDHDWTVCEVILSVKFRRTQAIYFAEARKTERLLILGRKGFKERANIAVMLRLLTTRVSHAVVFVCRHTYTINVASMVRTVAYQILVGIRNFERVLTFATGFARSFLLFFADFFAGICFLPS
jgi:hypothetical protein